MAGYSLKCELRDQEGIRTVSVIEWRTGAMREVELATARCQTATLALQVARFYRRIYGTRYEAALREVFAEDVKDTLPKAPGDDRG